MYILFNLFFNQTFLCNKITYSLGFKRDSYLQLDKNHYFDLIVSKDLCY